MGLFLTYQAADQYCVTVRATVAVIQTAIYSGFWFHGLPHESCRFAIVDTKSHSTINEMTLRHVVLTCTYENIFSALSKTNEKLLIPMIISRERPKSAPYLRRNKSRKPLFLQLETTKARKKLKIEEKNEKSPASRIVPKNVEGGTL